MASSYRLYEKDNATEQEVADARHHQNRLVDGQPLTRVVERQAEKYEIHSDRTAAYRRLEKMMQGVHV